MTWHILTGEYPPRPGGVADYSASIAEGLAQAGETVHVWTADPQAVAGAEVPTDGPGPVVHRWAGGWRRADLERLGAAIGATPGPRRLLVQYTPNAWGLKGRNLAFGPWLVGRRRRGDDVWAMIHEPYYPWRLRTKPTRWLLAAIHRVMMYDLSRACTRFFVASETYFDRLRPYDPGRARPMTWAAIPSALPTRDRVDAAAVAELRRRLAPEGGPLVGHFGTFGGSTESPLRAMLPRLLADAPGRRAVLVGRGGGEFAAGLVAAHPGLSGRAEATGGLEAADAAVHLAACDVLIQPYSDGISTRRSSAMAGLGLGMPMVTCRGVNTEPLWEESGGVSLADSEAGMVAAVEALLADPDGRDRLGRRALDLYERRFAAARTIEKLLDAADAGGPAPSRQAVESRA